MESWPKVKLSQIAVGSNIAQNHSSNLYEASPDGSAVWGVVVSTRWWLLVDHCVLRNWDRILVRAVKGLISRAGHGLDMSITVTKRR